MNPQIYVPKPSDNYTDMIAVPFASQSNQPVPIFEDNFDGSVYGFTTSDASTLAHMYANSTSIRVCARKVLIAGVWYTMNVKDVAVAFPDTTVVPGATEESSGEENNKYAAWMYEMGSDLTIHCHRAPGAASFATFEEARTAIDTVAVTANHVIVGKAILYNGSVANFVPNTTPTPSYTTSGLVWTFLAEDWVSGVKGALVAEDTTKPIFGSSCAKFTGGTNAAEHSIQIAFMKHFTQVAGSSTRDLTGCNIRLRYYVESGAGFVTASGSTTPIHFCLIGDHVASTGSMYKYTRIFKLPYQTGEWHDVIFTPADWATYAQNGFDISAVTGIMIFAYGDSVSGTYKPVIYFDRISIYSNGADSPAQVCIGIDDGAAEQIPHIKYAIKKGVRVYWAIDSMRMGTGSFATWAQVKELYETGMVDIVHHRDYPPYHNEIAMRTYCRQCKQDFYDQGIRGACSEVFVMPAGTKGVAGYGPYPSDILILREYFKTVRGTMPHRTGAGYEYGVGMFGHALYLPKVRVNPWWIWSGGLDATNYAAQIALAKTHQCTYTAYCHSLLLGGVRDVTYAQWCPIIDHIAAQAVAGNLVVKSITEI